MTHTQTETRSHFYMKIFISQYRMQEYHCQLSNLENKNMCSFRDEGFWGYTSQMMSINLYIKPRTKHLKRNDMKKGISQRSTFPIWGHLLIFKVTVLTNQLLLQLSNLSLKKNYLINKQFINLICCVYLIDSLKSNNILLP